MKKILLTTAILAVFTNYSSNATTAADRLAALRATRAAQQQQMTAAPRQPVTIPASALPAPKSIPQIREEDFRSMQTLIKNLELKTKE